MQAPTQNAYAGTWQPFGPLDFMTGQQAAALQMGLYGGVGLQELMQAQAQAHAQAQAQAQAQVRAQAQAQAQAQARFAQESAYFSGLGAAMSDSSSSSGLAYLDPSLSIFQLAQAGAFGGNNVNLTSLPNPFLPGAAMHDGGAAAGYSAGLGAQAHLYATGTAAALQRLTLGPAGAPPAIGPEH